MSGSGWGIGNMRCEKYRLAMRSFIGVAQWRTSFLDMVLSKQRVDDPRVSALVNFKVGYRKVRGMWTVIKTRDYSNLTNLR